MSERRTATIYKIFSNLQIYLVHVFTFSNNNKMYKTTSLIPSTVSSMQV